MLIKKCFCLGFIFYLGSINTSSLACKEKLLLYGGMIAKKIPCVTWRIKQPVSHKMWRETFLGTQIVFI